MQRRLLAETELTLKRAMEIAQGMEAATPEHSRASSRAYKAKGDRSQANLVTAVESRITPQLIADSSAIHVESRDT